MPLGRRRQASACCSSSRRERAEPRHAARSLQPVGFRARREDPVLECCSLLLRTRRKYFHVASLSASCLETVRRNNSSTRIRLNAATVLLMVPGCLRGPYPHLRRAVSGGWRRGTSRHWYSALFGCRTVLRGPSRRRREANAGAACGCWWALHGPSRGRDCRVRAHREVLRAYPWRAHQ